MTAVTDRAHPRPDAGLAQRLAADFDAVDLRSEPLRSAWGAEADDALARGIRSPLLRAIANRGVGYNNLDIAALAAAGIVATNTPGVLDETTADFAWAPAFFL